MNVVRKMAHRSSVPKGLDPVRAAERRKSAFLGKIIPDSEVSKETWLAPFCLTFFCLVTRLHLAAPFPSVGIALELDLYFPTFVNVKKKALPLIKGGIFLLFIRDGSFHLVHKAFFYEGGQARKDN